MKHVFYISLLLTTGCMEPNSMIDSIPNADALFQAELDQRGLEYTINGDGLYEITLGDVVATVNLDNVRRNYERDKDREAISRFAEQLTTDFFGNIPTWEDVQPLVRYSLEPSDYEHGFADTLHQVVTDELVKVFVYVSPDGSRISWITDDILAEWQTARDTVIALANKNMDQLVSETELEIEEIDDVPLGMLNSQETAFKASLILSSEFRDLVSPSHGWPVYIVVPARDFVYVIPQSNRDFLGRLGTVVVREYNESGYPITQDVLEVGDDGVTAIGSFAPKGE